ncbi:Protein MANBAL [Varanus komodoensis]|nr:Protein MANBAL [Varanus komodoensis]
MLGISAMAAELDFSPPEIPEPTFMEKVLHYGLFFGAIFQLICILAIILPIPKTHKMHKKNHAACSFKVIAASSKKKFWKRSGGQDREEIGTGKDTESFEMKTAEVIKKPKTVAASVSKKPKKETKKKR